MLTRRYELTDFEWAIIALLLSNKPSVARDDRGFERRLPAYTAGSPAADIPGR
jgi:hypothetical protein